MCSLLIVLSVILAPISQDRGPMGQKPTNAKFKAEWTAARPAPSEGRGVAVESSASPEEAYRTFLVALMAKDEKALRASTVPVADDDFDRLLKGEGMAGGGAKAFAFRAIVAVTPVRRLESGERFELPGGRALVAPEADDLAWVVPQGSPLPILCRKVEGRWLADPSAIIAGRKAADVARRRAEGEPDGG